jgi:hypothetical protein
VDKFGPILEILVYNPNQPFALKLKIILIRLKINLPIMLIRVPDYQLHITLFMFLFHPLEFRHVNCQIVWFHVRVSETFDEV